MAERTAIPNASSKSEQKSHLTLYIVGAIIAAVVLALLFPRFARNLQVGGQVFLRLLTMMVVPLVVASVMSGIIGLGDVRRLGRPGGYAVLYYMTTTILAVIVGLAIVNIVRPGEGFDQTALERVAAEDPAAGIRDRLLSRLSAVTGIEESDVAQVFEEFETEKKTAPSIGTILESMLLMLFTDNLFRSAVNTNLLPLIIFSIIFAGMLTTMGTRVHAIKQMIEQVNDALMSFILLLMKVAPFGIFCLVAGRFGEAAAEGQFLEELGRTAWYFSTVLAGLALHGLVTLPLIYWFFTRKNPYRFIAQMSQALLTAFSTSSSSATLPVTMECANLRGGVSKRSTEFVLPLGATINMDGTALYEAVAAIFIAQALGMPMAFLQQVTIALTATLAAIGAAGIPEAGLVTMLIVLNAVNLPVEYVSLILAVDWLLDRFRTTVNCYGDAVGAAVVDGTFPSGAPEKAPASESVPDAVA